MIELLPLGRTTVDLGAPLAFVLKENGFDLNRVDEWLKSEASFPSRLNKAITVKPAFIKFQKGANLPNTERAMFQLGIHAPTDLREILAVGRLIDQPVFTYAVFAPEITGAHENFLQIHSEKGWSNGFGLTVRTFQATDEPLSTLQMIGFQNV